MYRQVNGQGSCPCETQVLESQAAVWFTVPDTVQSTAITTRWTLPIVMKRTCLFTVYSLNVIIDRFIQRYSLLSSRLTALLSRVIPTEWLSVACFEYTVHGSGVLTALLGCYMADATRNYCRLSARSVYTIQPYTSLQCHFVPNHIRLAVSFHLHFPQNNRNLMLLR